MIRSGNSRRWVSWLAAGVLLALTGCPGKGGGDVMAKVNGYKILRSELDKALAKQTAGTPQKLTAEQEQNLRLQILQQLIAIQLYLQKAEKLGIVATDDEIETKLNQAKAPYTKEEFAKKLQEGGMNEDDYRQEIRRQLTIEKLLNKEIASKVTISNSDIQNYYNEHKAQFNVIEPQYHLAHIFVSTQPNAPGKTQNDAQARDKIRTAYNNLESGDNFADVAAKYSEDQDTARSGGELGPTPESQLKNTDAATRDAVLKLKPGQFTDVIPVINPATQRLQGYRIVKLLGKEAAGQRDVNDPEVQQFIRNQLRNQREQFLREAYDESLHDNAEIHNYYVDQILKSFGAQK